MFDASKLKLKVKTMAQENNLEPQDIMQMYFFERILYRISISKYKSGFILKGWLLLSSMFGGNRRTTQDMDAMIKGIPLNQAKIEKIVKEIINIRCDDGINYELIKTSEIRINDKYKGIRANLIGCMEHLRVPLSIDITTGDPVTPRELEYRYKCLFEDSYINIMAFNIETIIAEKFETLISDNILNTRAKDFYDLYLLLNEYKNKIDKKTLVKAIKNTFVRRNVDFDVEKISNNFNIVAKSDKLKRNFENYKSKKNYVSSIDYYKIMEVISFVIETLKEEMVII